MLLLGGYAPFIVSFTHSPLETFPYDPTAKEEVSRRKGDSTVLKYTALTQTPATDATATTGPATATPETTAATATPETTATTTTPETTATTATPETTAATSLAGATPEPTDTTNPAEEPSPSPTPHDNEPPNNPVPDIPEPDVGNEPQLLPPRDHSLRSRIPEPANDPNEQVSLSDGPDHFKRSPPPPGAFAFSGSSPFINPAAIQYLQTIPAGQRWTDMVNSYLRFEELPVVPGVRILILFILFHSLMIF